MLHEYYIKKQSLKMNAFGKSNGILIAIKKSHELKRQNLLARVQTGYRTRQTA